MKIHFSRIVAAVVLGSSLGFAAEATTLEEVFTQGELSGTVGWFGVNNDRKGGSVDDGFSNGYLNVGFVTAPYNGVSLGVSGWGSVKTSEKNDDDFKNAIADRSALSEAYIKVEHEGLGALVIGRQAVDFNWLTDYVDGVSAEITAVENLVLSMAWARRQAVIDIDEISESFTKMNGNDGIYMLEAKYTPIEALELNPYLYYGSDLLSAYGLKATLNLEPSEEVKTTTMAHYVSVSSDVVDVKDGSFMQLEQGVEVAGFNLGLGYMKTDKDGTGGIESFGDQSPFEEGNYVFATDAKTPYVRAEYELEGVKLSALYGQTKYEDAGLKFKEKELDVSVGYEIVKNLEASLIYVNIDNDDNAQSYDAFKAHIAYTF